MFFVCFGQKHAIYIQKWELLIFCILKLKNRQYKYVKANSQIIPKQNCTGGFWPPCTEQVIYECSTEYYMDIGLINLLAYSYEPPLTEVS